MSIPIIMNKLELSHNYQVESKCLLKKLTLNVIKRVFRVSPGNEVTPLVLVLSLTHTHTHTLCLFTLVVWQASELISIWPASNHHSSTQYGRTLRTLLMHAKKILKLNTHTHSLSYFTHTLSHTHTHLHTCSPNFFEAF
jgi:hypothetical protein